MFGYYERWYARKKSEIIDYELSYEIYIIICSIEIEATKWNKHSGFTDRIIPSEEGKYERKSCHRIFVNLQIKFRGFI